MNKPSEIYAQGYEPWDGERKQEMPPWFLIGTAGVRNIVASSGCLARTVFIIGFIVYYFIIAIGNFARFQLENLREVEFFRDFADFIIQNRSDAVESFYHMNLILMPSISYSILAMMFYGAQLISKDKRSNALQVYFSKAVSRFDYVLGKFLSIGIITSLVTLVPSALIMVIGLFFSTDHRSFFLESWYIPFLTGAYWLVLTLALGSITLFFSSCFNKGYMAGVAIIGFMAFTSIFSLVLVVIFGTSDMLSGFNLGDSIYEIGSAIFTLRVQSFSELFWQIFDTLLIGGGCLLLMLRKIRPVEVIQ